MRNVIYRLMFLMVAISVIISNVVWLVIGLGVTKGYFFLVSWYTFFANPLPQFIFAIPLFRTIPINLRLINHIMEILMLLLVLRRIIFFIKARKFATPPADFFLASYILGSIGVISLSIAIVVFIISVAFSNQIGFMHWFAIPFLLIARFFVPLAFFVNELWSLRQIKAVLS
jgi:hypothetical protein